MDKPTKKDVLSYMAQNFRKNISDKKNIEEFVGMAVGVGSFIIKGTYALPSAARIIGDYKKEKEESKAVSELSAAENLGGLTGVIGGFALHAAQSYIYIAHLDSKWMFLPVATNVVSGLYEIGKYLYERAEKEITDIVS